MNSRVPPKTLPEGPFDIAVIGAGVVGCAVARRFALAGARVLVLEKGPDILEGASKANSAILHTGFDEPTGSLEHRLVLEGYDEYLSLHERFGLPVERTGALVLAWSETQAEKLEDLMATARANGVQNVEALSQGAIREREPHLSPKVTAGFLVPGEYVIDPWTAPYLYLLQAIQEGAVVVRSTEVTSGSFDGTAWRLETSRGAVSCAQVINCAGLYGDRLDRALLGAADFEIRPRKGQFLVYDKAARPLLDSILLPVPTEVTKGIVVTPTIFGNILVGPTAEDQASRSDASVDKRTLEALKAEGERILPGLRDCLVTATYAGIRPASQQRDYAIRHRPEMNYCTVGGIRSTGLTGALGIAAHVARLMGQETSPPDLDKLTWPSATSLAEGTARDWQRPDNGGIVCHCELVTRREIEAALEGPLAVGSLGGLKRRTRATMGRCQGFFCTAELSEITAGRFPEPLGWTSDV